MAQLNNYIRNELDKFIKNKFLNIGANNSDDINELFRRLEEFEKRKDIGELLKIASEDIPETREDVVNKVIELTELADRLIDILADLESDKNEIISRIEEIVKHFEETNNTYEVSVQDLYNYAELLPPLVIKTSFETLEFPITNLKNLFSVVEKISNSINWEDYRKENKKTIESIKTDVKYVEKEYAKRISELEASISGIFRKRSEEIVNLVAVFNIPFNEIFQSFASSVKKLSNIEIDIEIAIPTMGEDINYALFLDAKENNDRAALVSIAIEAGFYHLYDSTSEEIVEFLENNYF